MTFVRLGRAVAICALLAGLPRVALAAGLVPPRLSHAGEAVDPRPAGESVTVTLELTIDEQGTVTDARAVDPPGEACPAELQEAAVAAARAFTFEPATRDDAPIAARIRYAYVFPAHEPPPPPVEPPLPAAPVVEDEPEPTYGAAANVEAPPREPTKRSLSREEMTRMPGTRGDPIRATELLPGVGRPPAGGGNPVLRGANLNDSQVFAEGAPVPLLYHFGGLSSFAHGRVLESVDVFPSNFSVRYGRKAGGVVDVRFRDPRTDGLHGIADVSLLESSLLLETPVNDKLSVLAAARRSNIDAVLGAVSSEDFAITSAPVYWDYQAIATFKPTERDRIRLVAWGSRDSFRFLLKKPSDFDPMIRGAISETTSFHDVQLGYRHRFDKGSEFTTELTYGRTDLESKFASIANGGFGINQLQGRSELALVVTPAIRVVAGADVLANHFDARYDGLPEPESEGGLPMAVSTQKAASVRAREWILQPGGYLEVGVRPVSRLLLLSGLRADYNDFVSRGSLDPRFTARWEVDDATTVKAGLGRFTQQPEESRVVAPIGNPALGLTHSTHLTVGAERKIGGNVTLAAEGFAKWLDGIVESTPDRVAPFYLNSQRGRAYGGELFARWNPTGRFFGFVSYTLIRSERRSPGEAWRLFERDTPHILNAAASYKLGHGWEVGAALRYTSGTPYTPVVASTYDAANDVYVPRAGAQMSARNPAYVRLDARVEKKWTFQVWSLSVYLDVQNVLNSPNREGFSYSYDYRTRDGMRGLPIFPALGLKGEL